MRPEDIAPALIALRDEDDFAAASQAVVDAISASDLGAGAVSPILAFMEENETVDFGTPGPLTHLVERFYGHGYEASLKASIERKPTAHTAWMFHRLINGTGSAAERSRLLELLQTAASHSEASDEARRAIADFLDA